MSYEDPSWSILLQGEEKLFVSLYPSDPPPPLLSLRVSYSLGKELPIFQGYVQPFKSFISFPNSLSKYLIQDSLISYLLDIYSNSGPKCEDPSKHTIIANRWVGVKKCPYLHIFEWTFTYYQKRL